ncbi:MAG: Rne/Rng family ribonuclease [Desulfocapsaceae bacterium]|nr:Rne/Rng family ribonuclease [Desulfocapsaceae bacterium]
MTEQKTNQEKKVKQPTKQERIKAKIGAWWKSTVTERVIPSEPTTSQKSLPSPPSTAGLVEQAANLEKIEESKSTSLKEVEERTQDGEPSQKTSRQKTEEQETLAKMGEKSSEEAEQESSKKQQKKKPASRGKRPSRDQGVDQSEDHQISKGDSGPEDSDAKTQDESDIQLEKSGQQQEERKNRKKSPTKQEQQELQEQRDQQTEEILDEEQIKDEPKPITKLLINAEEPEECRLALLENGQLESIHVATSTRVQTKNNIYKARIVAIEPNLQAAFVDYGTEKNGFLPFSEIHPEYYKENVSDKTKELINQHQWKKLSITDVMERGREVLVQVVKEEVGKKGANMTTYLSLPGRCVVLMPGSDSKGISRKISGEERRTKLRDHMLSLKIPEGIGWIVRTASIDITKAALGRDVSYLLRLWEEVKKKGQDLDGVGLIYQDHDHVLRFLREHFDPDLQEILVDDKDAFEQVKGFIEMLPAKQRNVKCKLHRGARPIFNQYSIEDQIESIYQPKVNLPSGGSIVIDPTEALVAIDVNSGSTSKGRNFEESIYQANMEAAKELARQLRLRDLGGLIVVDFIDMRSKKHVRDVERQVKMAMKRDKAKVDISRISKFGLMQISRQKLGAPIEAGNYRVCTHCKGRGIVRSVETLALFYLRRIHTAASRKMIRQVECHFPVDVAGYLLNNKRNELIELESKHNTEVIITAEPSYGPGDNEILFHKVEKAGTEKNKS